MKSDSPVPLTVKAIKKAENMESLFNDLGLSILPFKDVPADEVIKYQEAFCCVGPKEEGNHRFPDGTTREEYRRRQLLSVAEEGAVPVKFETSASTSTVVQGLPACVQFPYVDRWKDCVAVYPHMPHHSATLDEFLADIGDVALSNHRHALFVFFQRGRWAKGMCCHT